KSVALPLSYIGPRGKDRRTPDLRYIPPPGAKPAYYQCPLYLSSWPDRRATSYMATAPATEALSDSTPPRRGMAARRSQVRSTGGRSPVSPPGTGAGRGGRSSENRLCSARALSATLQ